jgi:outer membrane protein assembly factor BamD (BamD/ComL family)
MSTDYLGSYDLGTVAHRGMLRMARNLREQGHVYQAIYILKEVLADYPNTPESRIAAQEYAALGEYMEGHGMPHTALSMYKWLEQLSWRVQR